MTAAERAAEFIRHNLLPRQMFFRVQKREQTRVVRDFDKQMSAIIAREYAELEKAADKTLRCMVKNGSCEHQNDLRSALAKVRGANTCADNEK